MGSKHSERWSKKGPCILPSNKTVLGNQFSVPITAYCPAKTFCGSSHCFPAAFSSLSCCSVALQASLPPSPASWPQVTAGTGSARTDSLSPSRCRASALPSSLVFPRQPSRPHPTAAKQSSAKPADLHTSVQALCEV